MILVEILEKDRYNKNLRRKIWIKTGKKDVDMLKHLKL